MQLLVTPLRRLTSKANATLDQIGSPDSVLASVGPFITGAVALSAPRAASGSMHQLHKPARWHHDAAGRA